MGGSSIFFGGSVVAAFIAGSVALFAPCCISIMLPAYFATAFQNRRRMVAMTFLFAAGVATVILPIALGAQAVQRFITGRHEIVYLTMGGAMIGLAGYTLAGGKMRLPMPASGRGGRGGPLGVYSLGVFSGVASSCCAPVLAGVVALSGVASGFGRALGLGSAYVFGMVMPLFVISLAWDKVDWRSTRLFRPRNVTLGFGRRALAISASALASGVLLLLIGVATVLVALLSDGMPSGSGVAGRVSAHVQHYGSVVTKELRFVPGWLVAIVLIAAIAALARLAVRQVVDQVQQPRISAPASDPAPHPDREPELV